VKNFEEKKDKKTVEKVDLDDIYGNEHF